MGWSPERNGLNVFFYGPWVFVRQVQCANGAVIPSLLTGAVTLTMLFLSNRYLTGHNKV
jgi:hypothetical protein